MQKITQSRSQLWQQVKAIGNYGSLKWTSKTSDWQAFIQKREDEWREQREQQEEEYRQSHVTIAKIRRTDDDKQEDIAQIIDDLKDKLNQLPAGKLIRLTTGQEFITGSVENNKLADRIFQACQYDAEISADYEIFDTEVPELDDNQAYRIGDVNCLLNPILNTIDEKIQNSQSKNTKRSYQAMLNKALLLKDQFLLNGATKQLIQDLANATTSTIKVYDVINHTHLKFKQDKQQQSQFKFKFMNTRLNHVDIWEGPQQMVFLHPNPTIGRNTNKITRYTKETNEEGVSSYQSLTDTELLAQATYYGNYQNYSHMNDLFNQLRESGQTFKYSQFNNCIVKIDTGLETIMCNEYADLLDREQAVNAVFNKFTTSLRRERYDPKFKTMVVSHEHAIISMAMNQSGRVALKPKTSMKLKHIDMIAGYTQFQTLPEEYNFGFPIMTDLRKVTSVDFAIKHNGLYCVTLRNLPKHISCIFTENKPYSLCSAIIKYLRDHRVVIQIEGGMYGCDQESYQGNQFVKLPADCQVVSYGKKPYYTAISKWAISDESYKQTFFTANQEMAGIIKSNTDDIIIQKNSSEYTQIIKKVQKPRYKTKAHIYAFILQYQQLNMMRQLERMDMDKVHLLCGDDIYYEPHDFEILPIFRNKGKDNYEIIYNMTQSEGNTFIVNSQDNRYCEFGQQEPIYHQFQCHLGQGGSGKTFARHSDIGSINQVYLTLTNALVRDQKASPFQPKCYTKDKFLANMEKHKLPPSNFIIDEAGLVGDGIRAWISNNLPGARVYVLGDKYQVSQEFTSENTPFDETKYDLVLREDSFKTDYRAINCPKLQKLKLQIRKMVDMGYTEQQQYFAVHKLANKLSQQQWIDQYTTSQMITTCTNYAKDTWTTKLPGEKYRVSRTFTHKGNTYCTGDILLEIPADFDFAKDQKNKIPKLNMQHGFTTHSIQGTTHRDKLLMTCPTDHVIFKGYTYTAVSRLTKIEDLYCIQFNLKE